METSEKYIDEIFEFSGSWDIPSKCGLRHQFKDGHALVIVTELYLDNPGSSITSVSASLANQIATKFQYDPNKMIYIECNPNMKSKLSFYDEEYFRISFDIENNKFTNPNWTKLSKKEFINILNI